MKIVTFLFQPNSEEFYHEVSAISESMNGGRIQFFPGVVHDASILAPNTLKNRSAIPNLSSTTKRLLCYFGVQPEHQILGNFSYLLSVFPSCFVFYLAAADVEGGERPQPDEALDAFHGDHIIVH